MDFDFALCISEQVIPVQNSIHQIQEVRYWQAYAKKVIVGAHKVSQINEVD